MTIELALCIAMMLIALPVSKSISAHYAIFGALNYAMLGVEYADASLLALLFAALAAADTMLIIAGGRTVLVISCIASTLLSLESIFNMDWLLNHGAYLSAITNTAIAACVAKEYGHWMGGKHGRS